MSFLSPSLPLSLSPSSAIHPSIISFPPLIKVKPPKFTACILPPSHPSLTFTVLFSARQYTTYPNNNNNFFPTHFYISFSRRVANAFIIKNNMYIVPSCFLGHFGFFFETDNEEDEGGTKRGRDEEKKGVIRKLKITIYNSNSK